MSIAVTAPAVDASFVTETGITLSVTTKTVDIAIQNVGAQGAQGNPGINWRGVYVNGTSYAVADAVRCSGGSYIATAPSTGIPPAYQVPNAYWDVLALNGAVGTSQHNPVRIIDSGTSDTASLEDYYIAWRSAVTSAKTQTIPAGIVDGDGNVSVLTIKDAIGTAKTYPITIIGDGCTIDNLPTFTKLNFNGASVTLEWDGTSNWMAS